MRLDLVNCYYIPQLIQDGISDKRIIHISAWINSACVTVDNYLYMWGSGVFGDYETPKNIDMTKLMGSENQIKIETVSVGGTFALIQDTH